VRRVALVTGAAGGIGRATVALFAGAGWHVIAVDRRSSDPLPPGARAVVADMADPEAARGVMEDTARSEGQLDALVNNAAIQHNGPLVAMEPAAWDEVMACNVRSVFLGVRYGVPLLRDRNASIVNVASVHAIATSSNIAAYAASKGAVVALTRALALELAIDGIRVNAVLPGAVDTQMLRDGLRRRDPNGGEEEDLLQELRRRHPIGRIGQPNEIAEAIMFLADGARSSFMTGQVLIVDGGACARLSTE